MVKKSASRANDLMFSYVATINRLVDKNGSHDGWGSEQLLKFANRTQKAYQYQTDGHNINEDLYKIYHQNKGKESVRIGEHDVPMSRIETLCPVLEKNIDLKRHTDLTSVTLDDIIAVYNSIDDSVSDIGYETEEISSGAVRTERKIKDHPEDLAWLGRYVDVDGMVTADDLDYSLVGTIVDVQGIHQDRRLGDSKLALAVETEGQTILVNVRGEMHRNYGYITDSRVKQLKESLPKKDIDVTSDWELKQWFDEAGVEKSAYMKAKERAMQKLKQAQQDADAIVDDKGLSQGSGKSNPEDNVEF